MLCIFAFAFVATACGGGGGGGGGGGSSPPLPTYSISGTVSGGAQAGVTITVSPGGQSTVTTSNGSYVLSGIPYGGAVPYTITPSLAGYTFTPFNAPVVLNGADVTGVNFTTPVPMLTTGKILYPSYPYPALAIRLQDLSTGTTTTLWNGGVAYAERIVPARAGNKVSFMGSNLNGMIMSLSMPTGVLSIGIPGYPSLNQYCSTVPKGSFDVSPLGDYAVFSNGCVSADGLVGYRDIFLVKMDGLLSSIIRVTDDYAMDYSPAFCGTDAVSGNVFVCFVSNKSGMRGVWKQAINPTSGLLVGPQVIVTNLTTDVMELKFYSTENRTISVNADYTQVAFMKNVGGISHIAVVPLAGGAEVDLGEGSLPYWAVDGSNKILFTSNHTLEVTDRSLWRLFAINPDGTGKMQVPIPSDLNSIWLGYGVGNIVFAPAGF
ncbi:MAG: hypothetical protein HZB11_03180 [Candidatus Yonathbacteria bacterium]|nr:hypothetical protein [Candidatus Yonathbacteria bacterium]